MHKNALFLLKISKNHSALGVPLLDLQPSAAIPIG